MANPCAFNQVLVSGATDPLANGVYTYVGGAPNNNTFQNDNGYKLYQDYGEETTGYFFIDSPTVNVATTFPSASFPYDSCPTVSGGWNDTITITEYVAPTPTPTSTPLPTATPTPAQDPYAVHGGLAEYLRKRNVLELF